MAIVSSSSDDMSVLVLLHMHSLVVLLHFLSNCCQHICRNYIIYMFLKNMNNREDKLQSNLDYFDTLTSHFPIFFGAKLCFLCRSSKINLHLTTRLTGNKIDGDFKLDIMMLHCKWFMTFDYKWLVRCSIVQGLWCSIVNALWGSTVNCCGIRLGMVYDVPL